MQKQVSTPVVVAIVAVVVIAILGYGWYVLNPPSGPIGPKPGTDIGLRRLGDGKTAAPSAFNRGAGRSQTVPPR
jgi:hypothetical protein